MITIGTLLSLLSLFCLTVGFDAFIYKVSIQEVMYYLFEDLGLGLMYKIIFCMMGIGVAIWSDYKRKINRNS